MAKYDLTDKFLSKRPQKSGLIFHCSTTCLLLSFTWDETDGPHKVLCLKTEACHELNLNGNTKKLLLILEMADDLSSNKTCRISSFANWWAPTAANSLIRAPCFSALLNRTNEVKNSIFCYEVISGLVEVTLGRKMEDVN